MLAKIVLLTNIPVPYRERIHEIVAEHYKGNYTVIYCAKSEPNRHWKTVQGNYPAIYLSETSKAYIHNQPEIWNELNILNPEVVITTGFNPTMLYAFAWCILHNKKHIAFTDGTLHSERDLSFLHKIIRKIVYARSKSFLGPSNGSVELYKSYNINESRIFKSHLCIDNTKYTVLPVEKKEYDLMFSGQLVDRKMPLFFVEVANKIKESTGQCKVLILGKGELQEEILSLLKKSEIEFEFPGFIQPELLPQYYSKSKLFLFPTKNDPWGVVANEAMASGVPVITCENAGVAYDLIVHCENGFILPLDIDVWAKHSLDLLDNKELYLQ
ncbi:MAG: glycosyltransferase family 4 protein, partial [Bacteroidota bacterium]|nr:glycosyltransferase family 4 protein [Bacteroidota bacterium]